MYTKLIFAELIESIERILAQSVVDTLVLEGLPIRDCYALTVAKGLAENSSLKHLSFQRSNLGDAAAVEICQTLSLMMNLETLDLSECDLSSRGAEAIANVIKAQKVHRYSIAWTDSLRYRDVNPDDFAGLRTLNVRNNTKMSDEGVKFICNVLCDDEWVKEIDMANCGIENKGAECIIQCLNVNKTITSFNIAQNYGIADQFHKHIALHLASSANSSESSGCSLDSLDSEIPKTVQKNELLEKIKFLRYRYEVEMMRRQRVEELIEIQNDAMKKMEHRIMLQGAFKIPDGFTLVDNDTFQRLLSEKLIPPRPVVKAMKAYRLKKPVNYPRRVVSSKSVRVRPVSIQKPTKSELHIERGDEAKKVYFEKNIGDNLADNSRPSTVSTLKNESGEPNELGDSRPCTIKENTDGVGEKLIIKLFEASSENEKSLPTQKDDLLSYDPRNLFKKSSNLVPCNSDSEE